LAIRKIKIGKVRDGERPNWGLAQLMRPAKAAAAVPLANLPLCQRPNACASNHRGFLARWQHTKPPCLTHTKHIVRPSERNKRTRNRRFSFYGLNQPPFEEWNGKTVPPYTRR